MNGTITLFYIIVFVVILVTGHRIINNRLKHERFIPSFTMSMEQKPDVLNITYPYSAETQDINGLLGYIHQSQYKQIHDDQFIKNVEDMIITDAFTLFKNKHFKEHLTFLSGTNSEKCAYFIRSLEVSEKQFSDKNVIIGYTNDVDTEFINIIMKSLKTQPPTFSLKKIKIDEKINIIDKSVFTTNNIHVLFIFESLESNVITKKLDRNMKIEVWDYADLVDIHTLKVQVPFIKKKNIDFSLYFPQLKGKLDIVSSVFVIDIVIAIDESKTKKKNINSELDTMVRYYNKPELINMYEQFFGISTLSSKFAKNRNDFFMKRDSLQVLEQFNEDKTSNGFAFDISKNVNGFYDSGSKRLYVYTNMIDGIPLKLDSMFHLFGQVRDEQNGLYNVISTSSKQSILGKLEEQDTSKHTKRNNDIGYSCYNHRDITTKSACESLYDELGNKKHVQTYWDKPCEFHADCPFYQSNKNYKNYRGGCIDGRCEFPVGIKPVSYRLFDKSSQPVCHSCNTNSPYCCEQQKSKELYPTLSSPDYAFELDNYERYQTNTL